MAKNAFAASMVSNVWATVTSLRSSSERSTWCARTPCSAWIGAKLSYTAFQAS